MELTQHKCVRCRRNAVYHRRYSGENLCGSCFKKSIIEKTRKTISKYDMIRYGEKIAVAVSGGKDSLSLLDVLSRITPGHGEKIVVITVDEGIADYRDEAMKLVARMTSKLGLTYEVVSFKSIFGFTLDDALENKDRIASACAVCGILRRRAIDIAAKNIGADLIATAHNLDDFLQTFLINLTSGDSRRLDFLDPGFKPQLNMPRRIKPFVELYEEEIAFYAYLSKIPFQTISCPYMGEGIRTEIRTFLNNLERHHTGVKYSTFNTSLKLLTRIQVTKPSRRCEECGYPSSSAICSTCMTVKLIQNQQI